LRKSLRIQQELPRNFRGSELARERDENKRIKVRGKEMKSAWRVESDGKDE